VKGRRIRTAVYGVFVAFSAAFVLLSTWQIMIGVFGAAIAPVQVTQPAGKACAEGIHELERALDRGVAAATGAKSSADAEAKMRAALSPEWDKEQAVDATCAGDPHGADAWAALLRLRRAEEGAAGRRTVVVAPLRQDLDAYLAR
jgi:hypothetical protein